MGYYNVIASCVVNGLHYIRPTVQPIELDDETAAPLVGSGSLEAYAPGASEVEPDGVIQTLHLADDLTGTEEPAEVEDGPKRRTRRRSDPDDAA